MSSMHYSLENAINANNDRERSLANVISKASEEKMKKIIRFHELFRFATRPDWFYMFLGTIGAIGHGASIPLLWLMFGYMTDSFTDQIFYSQSIPSTTSDYRQQNKICNRSKMNLTSSEDIQFSNKIQHYSIYITLIGFGAFVCAYIQTYFWAMSGERQIHRIRYRTFQSLVCNKNIFYFDRHSPGELITLVSDGIRRVNDGIGENFGSCLQYLSLFTTGLIIGFARGYKLTGVILSLLPVFIILVILYSKFGAQMVSKQQETYTQAGQLAEQTLSAVKTVFAFNGSDFELKRYEQQLLLTRKNGIRIGAMFGLVTGFDYLIVFAADALGLGYGAKLIREQKYTIGQTLMVFFTVINALFALERLAPYLQAIISAKGSAHEIWKIIDTEKEFLREESTGELEPTDIDGSVAFVNVHFAYPSRPTVSVLNDVSFNISAGQTVAIVGSTGSGKSTCFELLEKLYELKTGSILLDNQPLNQYNIQWLRTHISVVSQQPILFETTVMENIRMGCRHATNSQIVNLCKNLGIHETIVNLSQDKYETRITQNGSNLSGGQRQKIALARALLKNPRILLLDEATAALDSESEHQLQKAIEEASADRTTIVIAHRLSTIRNADNIIVFDCGRIIEMGKHEFLMRQKGKYYELVQNQLIDDQIDTISEEHENDLNEFRNQNSPIENQIEVTPNATIKKKKRYFSFFKLLALNKPEWYYIVFGCLAAIINGGVEPVFALILSQLVSSFFFSLSSEGLTLRLRLRAYRTMLKQNVSWFDRTKNSTGVLCVRLATEASSVHEATGVLLGICLRSVSNLTIGLILGFYASWQLTITMCAFILLLIGSGWLQTKVLTRFIKMDSIAIEKAASIFSQMIQNIRTVVHLTEEKTFLGSYARIIDEPYRKLKRRSNLNALLFALTNSIPFFAQAALFSYGACLVRKDKICFDDIILIFSVVMFGAVSVSQSFAMAPNYAKARSAAKKLFDLFDLEFQEHANVESENSEEDRVRFDGIEFKDVTFAYESRPDATILNKFSLKIRPGQHIALIGASGCGKSTAIQLIERFYNYSNGSIIMNSQDIRKMNINKVRSNIALVSQEAVLFDASIRDNIKYGDLTRDISDEEIIRAAERANIHDFIHKLPEGYATMVGSRGFQLSGGERQRIAIARAIVRRANLLLLDEPTSALDTSNEQTVQKGLEEAKRNSTSITIAHRLTTIRSCDLIYVVGRGRIMEFGNHEQLMGQKGYYFKLVQSSK
ncbi:unnamed protein product [Rotaria socialis]|uniref:Uncharacterized protein n=1 Tax=Rotaria socialis TaxID=392032 RepID=A0A821EK75_9BILA|nr:unnamed protein product [Rotaria socialis]CAF4637542.1 unnamed protein product [Rotaria socialis]